MATTAATSHIAQRYQLINQLGAGGMGVVYRALDRLSGQIVALKQVTVQSNQLEFASRPEDSQDMRLALAHEFKTLASLRHPNIVSVIDYGFDTQRQPFFTMTLLEGAQTILKAGHKQPAEVKDELVVQLLQALVYLHRRGILHRDLKPGNVLVVNGQVKVLDFGLSIAHGEDAGTSGTLAYMAPELFQGGLASEASDLYAVGMIAYELFAGRHPFRQEPIHLLLDDILNCDPDPAALGQSEFVTQVVARLLAKRPEARYSDSATVLAELSAVSGQQQPTETALTRESLLQAARFVGREAELGRLSEALAATLKGEGSLWLVGGESGIGKSRLLDELRTLALVEGALVLRGQAVGEGGTPYQIWRDALRQLCLHTELNDLERSVLKPLVPDIGTLLECKIPDAPELDPQATQDRLLAVISEILARQSQPTVAILEDVQWAGSESIAVLKRLGPQVGQQALLIIASYRSDERPDLPGELPAARPMSLERLPQERIADLSASILGEATGRQSSLTDLLERETEGNVFFVVEVLRALAEEVGQLDRIGTTTLPSHIFSGGMKTIVQRRLRRVPDWAQSLLQAAATIGRQIDPTLLRVVQPQTGLDDWLAVCADAHILEFQDNQWRFSHDKLREGVLADLPPERRQELHEQVAVAIEQCYASDLAQAPALAGHWAIAGNAMKEAHYASLAGEQAAAIFANREAIPFLERADALAAQVGTSLEHRLRHLYLLGTAYFDGPGDYAQAVRQLERALTLAGTVKPKSQAQTAVKIVGSLARQVWHRLKFDALKRPQRSGPHSELFEVSAEACAHMAQIQYLFNDKLASLYYGLASLNLAEQAGPAYLYLQARGYLVMVGVTAAIPFHSVARYYRRRAEVAAQASNRADVAVWAGEILGMYAAGRAQWADAQQHLSAGAQLADKIGNARRRGETQIFQSMMLLLLGNWAETAALCQAIYAAGLQRGDVSVQFAAQLFGAVIDFYQGRLEQAEAAMRACCETYKQQTLAALSSAMGLIAQCCSRQRLFERAEECLRQFEAMPGLDAPTTFYLVIAYFGAAEAALTLLEGAPSAERRLAARRLTRLLSRFGRIYDCGQPFALVHEGWLAWLESQPKRAVKIGQHAIRAAQRLEMPYAEGLAHYHLGRHLPPEDSRHVEHLRQAKAIFQRLGAAYDLERTHEVLARAGEVASTL